jgi:hypothetical protein
MATSKRKEWIGNNTVNAIEAFYEAKTFSKAEKLYGHYMLIKNFCFIYVIKVRLETTKKLPCVTKDLFFAYMEVIVKRIISCYNKPLSL